MPLPEQLRELRQKLNALLDFIRETDFSREGVQTSQLARIRGEIAALRKELKHLSAQLDAAQLPSKVFDPSDPEQLGVLIARELLAQERHPLGGLEQFYGSGVYALYYNGDFDAYRPISRSEVPIYVGKMDPKHITARTPQAQGTQLWSRLELNHAKSVNSADNLALSDFECRYLVVRSAWQMVAEAYLIDVFKPAWNKEIKICSGFGKHGDSASTRSNKRSQWDQLHPGRSWAWEEGNRPCDLTAEEISEKTLGHYRLNPPDVLLERYRESAQIVGASDD